ncbi:peptidoglycan DD-metalloendopeptidase family protein [Georgenia sp. EYE_87]|uniref:peptidoglycan DD-metalloendopeptidase family protein n=1 Tax=Georgenia sp. EYE_87 TaxID=2853448 RepID=UPI002006749A|nr:peptidoglycan DD-metalloendopeptidase family protein [Georgenia sp. EYE_87]MCK6212077.1 peptidoglycan DD-metalloendopeptidase family protein [Georgenia sp. EYE_87]
MRRPSPAPAPRAARRPVRALGAVVAAALVALSLGAVGAVAHADSRDDLVREQERNEAEREKVESSLEGVDADLAATYLKLEDAKAKLPVAQEKLAAAEKALAAAERKQEQVAGRLDLAEAESAALEADLAAGAEEIDSTRAAMGELARSTYRGDNAVTTLEVVLDSSSTDDFLQSYAVMGSAVRSQTQVLDDLETASAVARNQRERQTAVTARIGELKEEADAAVVAADEARAAAAEHKAEIEKIQADMTALSQQLEDQKKQYAGQLADLEADSAELAREIARIDEENRRKEEERKRREAAARAEAERRAAASRNQSRPAPAPAAPAPASTNFLAPPVPSVYVTSPYGYRVYPITGGWFMHNGVDLRSACGNPQYASAGGTVVGVRGAYGNGTHGNQVLINHGVVGGSSYITVYNHLSGFAVTQGQQVSQGQTIGYTGATGNVTGCHVHFEVWKNGATIDPMTLPGF